MFNNDFYPTPKPMFDRMWAKVPSLYRYGDFLEPSAGDGRLVEFIANERCDRKAWREGDCADRDIDCIEIESSLRAILWDKGWSVIHDDFLTFKPRKHYNVIFGNFPFSNGAAHALHAWEIGDNTFVVGVVNAETFRNPYTEERKRLVKIVEEHGDVEYIAKGFLGADVSTPVEAALFTFKTPARSKFKLEWQPTTGDNAHHHTWADLENSALAPPNVFESMERQYTMALDTVVELLSLIRKLQFYGGSLLGDGIESEMPFRLLASAFDKGKYGGIENVYDKFQDAFNEAAWRAVYEQTNIASFATSGVQKQIEAQREKQGRIPFTVFNMQELHALLHNSKESIMTECVLAAFDLLTKHHKDNREHVEGWKSNSSYHCGKRMILPVYVEARWRHSGRYINYKDVDTVRDIDKGICLLVGKPYEAIDSLAGRFGKMDESVETGKVYLTEFFEAKLYKKGTLHLKWRDESVRAMFNQFAAEHYPFRVPEKTKKGVYN